MSEPSGFLYDWIAACEFCEWKKSYRNPVAALFGLERHWDYCTENCRTWAECLKKGAAMPDRGKYFQGGNFLKAPDVKDGQTVIIEKFEEATTRLGVRPILRLKGIEKPLGLNATNYDKMVEKFSDDERKWAGKRIRLQIVQAPNPSAGGKMTPSLRIE